MQHQFCQRMGDLNKTTANNMNSNNDDDAINDRQSFTFNHAQNQDECKHHILNPDIETMHISEQRNNPQINKEVFLFFFFLLFR